MSHESAHRGRLPRRRAEPQLPSAEVESRIPSANFQVACWLAEAAKNSVRTALRGDFSDDSTLLTAAAPGVAAVAMQAAPTTRTNTAQAGGKRSARDCMLNHARCCSRRRNLQSVWSYSFCAPPARHAISDRCAMDLKSR